MGDFWEHILMAGAHLVLGAQDEEETEGKDRRRNRRKDRKPKTVDFDPKAFASGDSGASAPSRSKLADASCCVARRK